MKRAVLAICSVLIFTACTKSEQTTSTQNEINADSTLTETVVVPEADQDSVLDNTSNTPEVENSQPTPPPIPNDNRPKIPDGPTDGVVTTSEYIYSDYPSNNLPMEKLTRKITNENQVVYVKIQDAKAGESFQIKVEHSNPNGNISIQHVYGPAVQDGPFGREANYTVPKNGDYTFAIQKNTRAEGKQTGDILVTVAKK